MLRIRLCLYLVEVCFNCFCIVWYCLLRLVLCIAFREVFGLLVGRFAIGLGLNWYLVVGGLLGLCLVFMLFGVVMFGGSVSLGLVNSVAYISLIFVAGGGLIVVVGICLWFIYLLVVGCLFNVWGFCCWCFGVVVGLWVLLLFSVLLGDSGLCC